MSGTNIMQLRQQVMELRAERDALRRTLCRMFIDPNAFAEAKDLDCFKEKYNLFLTDNEKLERQIDEANAEVEQLRQQRDEAKSKIERIMEGLEGCCMTCEPVGVRNHQMTQDIKTLKAERNVARREVCRSRASCIQGKSPLHIADALGWDCFADETADTSEHL